MKKWCRFAAVAFAISVCAGVAQAGPISYLKDKLIGSDSQDEQPAQMNAAAPEPTPAPAETHTSTKSAKSSKGKPQLKVVEGTPPPVGTPQHTPSKEEIQKGAQKLAVELNAENIPSDLFQKYAGKWKGDFWVYTPSGKKEQSQATSIDYTLNPDGTMKMESFSFDRISKTWVVAETATYVNEGNTVRVTIRRPNNTVTKQTGHYKDGQLFLTADISDGVEHYRERIDGKRLLVDGFGVYKSANADAHVFIGRFLRER